MALKIKSVTKNKLASATIEGDFFVLTTDEQLRPDGSKVVVAKLVGKNGTVAVTSVNPNEINLLITPN